MNNNKILDKVDEIIKEIENSDNYKKYLKIRDEISKNKDLVLLINEVRQLNKDLTHKYVNKEEYDKKKDELNNRPLYREYLNIISEINNELNIIETTINNYFYRKLNN